MTDLTPEQRDPMVRPRYTGIATFMRAPHAETPDDLDIAMIGVPYDGGVTNRPGARHGPREVRNQSSLMRKINQATGVCPYDLATIADIGDAWVMRPFALENAHEEIKPYFDKVHAAGAIPLSCGGDHSISLPILRALASDRPVGLIQIDAHADTGDDYLGSRFHHGAPFRRAAEEGLIDPKRTIQIGIRGGINARDHWQFSYDSGMRLMQMDEAWRLGVDGIVEEARRVVGDGPVYLTFDIDSLDPVYAMGTGTPEVGGFTTLEAQLILRGLRGLDFIGADMVEVAPPFDLGGLTALAGASVMFEQLCLLAEAVAARKKV